VAGESAADGGEPNHETDRLVRFARPQANAEAIVIDNGADEHGHVRDAAAHLDCVGIAHVQEFGIDGYPGIRPGDRG
jgi:hypothetical protein